MRLPNPGAVVTLRTIRKVHPRARRRVGGKLRQLHAMILRSETVRAPLVGVKKNHVD